MMHFYRAVTSLVRKTDDADDAYRAARSSWRLRQSFDTGKTPCYLPTNGDAEKSAKNSARRDLLRETGHQRRACAYSPGNVAKGLGTWSSAANAVEWRPLRFAASRPLPEECHVVARLGFPLDCGLKGWRLGRRSAAMGALLPPAGRPGTKKTAGHQSARRRRGRRRPERFPQLLPRPWTRADFRSSTIATACGGCWSSSPPIKRSSNSLMPTVKNAAVAPRRGPDGDLPVRHHATRRPWSISWATEPTPDFAAQVAEEYGRLLELLGRRHFTRSRRVEDGRLWQRRDRRKLGCSRRTVARKLDAIRILWNNEPATVSPFYRQLFFHGASVSQTRFGRLSRFAIASKRPGRPENGRASIVLKPFVARRCMAPSCCHTW